MSVSKKVYEIPSSWAFVCDSGDLRVCRSPNTIILNCAYVIVYIYTHMYIINISLGYAYNYSRVYGSTLKDSSLIWLIVYLFKNDLFKHIITYLGDEEELEKEECLSFSIWNVITKQDYEWLMEVVYSSSEVSLLELIPGLPGV